MTDELDPLSKKHQLVLDKFLICWNKTKAYQDAYPSASYNSAKASACRLFTDVNFLAHLQARLDEVHMSADEALKLLADIARADLGEFTNQFGGIDWVEAKQKGLTKLVKKWKVKTITINGKEEDKEISTEEIELHDQLGAIRDVLKIAGKFVDKHEIGGIDGKDLKVVVEYVGSQNTAPDTASGTDENQE